MLRRCAPESGAFESFVERGKIYAGKGRIDVHLWQEESEKGADYVCTHFMVEDTGIGMSEEFQKKIFDTFAREEENEKVQKIVGTGLGTSITKNIVTLMGGTIKLRSRQGEGSCFHVIVDFKGRSRRKKRCLCRRGMCWSWMITRCFA